MDIKTLTQEMNKFVTAKGWYSNKSQKPQSARNLAISLVLEASEVLEHYQWTDESHDLQELSGELADVTLYLLQLASVTGIDLEQAVLAKLEKNYQRIWPGNSHEGGIGS